MQGQNSAIFDYISFNQKPKPIVNIKFQYGINMPLNFLSLIDSGADYCTSYKSIGESLGVDFSDYDKEKNAAFGAGGQGIDGYKTPINLWIGIFHITTEIIWLDKPFLPDRSLPFLIGRLGIFDKFDILFQEKIRKITFTKTN